MNTLERLAKYFGVSKGILRARIRTWRKRSSLFEPQSLIIKGAVHNVWTAKQVAMMRAILRNTPPQPGPGRPKKRGENAAK